MITNAIFDQMTTDERWLGFGYLGERRNLREAVASGERPAEDLEWIEKADSAALAQAEMYNLSFDQLFDWANSRRGRIYADCWFGSGGQHARSYLPTEFGHLFNH